MRSDLVRVSLEESRWGLARDGNKCLLDAATGEGW